MPAANHGIADHLQPEGATNRLLAQVLRELRELRAARRLESATIGSGGLKINSSGGASVEDDFGNLLLLLGALLPGFVAGGQQYGFLLYRCNPDGTPGAAALTMYNSAGNTPQTLGLYDAQGNNLWTDDALAGQGIGRPYLDVTMGRSDSANWPSTNSGSYQDMFFGWAPHQHPKIQAQGRVIVPSGVNAGLQLTGNGTLIGAPITITGSTGVAQAWQIGPVAWAGNHMDVIDLRLQASITSGSGTVQVQVSNVRGVQS